MILDHIGSQAAGSGPIATGERSSPDAPSCRPAPPRAAA